MRKISSLLILGIVALVVSLAYSGYLYWDNGVKADKLGKIESSLVTFQKAELQSKNKEVLEAITAKRSVNVLTTDLIRWSKVIRDVRSTMPKNGRNDLVGVLSYSGGQDGKVTLNAKTIGGSSNPYFDVAQVIETFTDSPYFAEIFVPSIASGLDEDGQEILSFSISGEYIADPVVETEKEDLTSKQIQR